MLSVIKSLFLFLLCCCSLLVFVVVNIQISTKIQCECIMCQEMSLAPFCSLDALFWFCGRMFQSRDGYFGYPGKSQNQLSFSSTHLANKKRPSYCLEKDLSTRRTGALLVPQWFPTVLCCTAVTPATSESQNFYDLNGFKPWINCILHFPAVFPASFVTRAFQYDTFGPLILEHCDQCKWCQMPLMVGSACPTAQKLPWCSELYINI